MSKILFKDGNVVSPDSTRKLDVLIDGEKIVKIGQSICENDADHIIDAKGKYLIPGLIDTHVHIGWPDWNIPESYEKESISAAFGGVTTMIDRMNLDNGPIEEQIFKEGGRIDVLEANSYVDCALQCALYTPENLEEIPSLYEKGILGFKFYIPYRGKEAVPPQVGIDDGIIYFGFDKIAKTSKYAQAQVHAENIEIFFQYKDKILQDEEFNKIVRWAETRPNFVELEAIIRCAYFAKITGATLYIVHLSTKEGPELIEKLRGEGINIIAETCPQYLVMNYDDADRILSKVNPPIRTKEDNQGLWDGINKGIIETLGSDHAPCAKKHKQEFWSAVVGMAGIETMLPIMLTEGVNKERITLEKLVEISSYNCAKYFNLLPRKGLIDVGYDADIVMVDLDKEYTLSIDDLHSLSDFSPYDGWKMKGAPVLTMVRGKVVVENGMLKTEKGHGKFIPSEAKY
ncbi:MAG: dihydroorotase [Erysipelotrichaceae bacterium]|jgi:allantoinase